MLAGMSASMAACFFLEIVIGLALHYPSGTCKPILRQVNATEVR